MKQKKDIKCLIAGVGSVGRRHLRNLRALGVRDFVLYRRNGRAESPDAGELDGLPVETDLQAALSHQPDLAIISNPTALHLETALCCARVGIHLFIEKPLAHAWHGCDELIVEAKKQNLVVMTGFQFRFHPGIWQVKKLLGEGAIGQVVSAQAHWGESETENRS